MLSLEKQNEWRKIYQQNHPHWLPATEQYAAIVRDNLPSNGQILDLGCGRGGLVEQLNLTTGQVIGIDPDWHSLATHRLSMPLVQGISDALPFTTNQFDLIFSSWVVEHLERPLLTLKSIYHCLKPGGVFIFITPNGRHPLAKVNQLLGRLDKLQNALVEKLYNRANDDTFPTYYRANSSKAITTLCQETGLNIERLHYVPDPTYLAFTPMVYKASCWLESLLPENRKIHLIGILRKPA